AYEYMDTYFPAHKIILTGNPIRQFLIEITDDYQTSCRYFGLTPNKTTVLVLGGSQGADMIGKGILEAIDVFAENDIQVILSTSKAYFEKINQQVSRLDAH